MGVEMESRFLRLERPELISLDEAARIHALALCILQEIGLEVLALSFQRSYLIAGLVAVPLVLAARWITVLLQVGGFSLVREFSDKTVRILTWGGLRGGISVALALSLPSGPERDAVVTITYVVVVFSILVQGLTISRVVGGSEGSATATTSPT